MKSPAPTPIVSDLMTVPMLMAYLGKSRPHVYKLMEEEGLPARRIGGRWHFAKAEVDGWLKTRPGVNVPKAG